MVIKVVDKDERKHLQNQSDLAYRSFTNEERYYNDDYTTGSHDCINPYLYGKFKGQNPAIRNKYSQIVGHLDSAIGKFDPREDIIVYSELMLTITSDGTLAM